MAAQEIGVEVVVVVVCGHGRVSMLVRGGKSLIIWDGRWCIEDEAYRSFADGPAFADREIYRSDGAADAAGRGGVISVYDAGARRVRCIRCNRSHAKGGKVGR